MPNRNVHTTINGKLVELKINPTQPKLEVLCVGEEDCSAEEIKQVHDKVDKISDKIPEDKEIVDYIEDLQNQTEGKEWWESKTVWVNVSALLMMILSYFGFSFFIDPEVLLMIASIVVPALNVWLRNKTNSPIKKKKKKL